MLGSKFMFNRGMCPGVVSPGSSLKMVQEQGYGPVCRCFFSQEEKATGCPCPLQLSDNVLNLVGDFFFLIIQI